MSKSKNPPNPASDIGSAIMAHLDKDRLLALTRETIDIPSPMGGEKEVGEFLGNWMRESGLEVKFQEVEPGRSNVIGTLRGTGEGPSLMYCGHMDTTWAGDEEGIVELGPGYGTPSFTKGEWIFGAGAYNMKSGLTSAIAAVDAVARSGQSLKGDLMVACVVGETCHTPVNRFQGPRYRGCGVGGSYLVNHGVTADLAVIPEPTTSRVSFASGGYVYFEIRVLGNPGATYVRGGTTVEVKKPVDALNKVLELREHILTWAEGYKERTRYRGQPATNVTIIALEAGHPWRPTKNPPFARMYVEVDTMPGQHPADVVAEFSQLIREKQKEDPALDVTCDVVQLAHGAEVAEDDLVVTATARAHERVHGSPPEITFDAWFADTASFTRCGIPTICYGPGGRSSEGGSGYYPRSGEQASIEDLYLGSQVYVLLAADICMMSRAEFCQRYRVKTGTIVY